MSEFYIVKYTIGHHIQQQTLLYQKEQLADRA
uniref:Uncharacterized protein n=1 Tax=Arundo donax TaxID=35708 RepID=A0A0A8XTG3_ARUDO